MVNPLFFVMYAIINEFAGRRYMKDQKEYLLFRNIIVIEYRSEK